MQAGGLQGKLVRWALRAGRDYMLAKITGRSPPMWLAVQFALARRLVLGKLRLALGLDRLKFFVSGSAPLHLDTAMTLRAASAASSITPRSFP